ncbi:MAG: ABC transporter ATP-binding protein/permease [Firmicutes bacterium]|nr:ABC transporter ATP-binding protein/permease [Bacillota bacterium]
MIKLNKLEKYFNRNQKNEIHVINDISLDLPEKGLVVLLGPSGSGKTTLLNVLGGLDKVQSGTIIFGDEEINRYKSKVWDKIRNKQVGYIFQNYNLLNNLTVYDNIALTLNMVGVVDKDEVEKRIDYILDSMGMINYRKRRASQLSGGQQQRVAIARALAKNPKVIIADEPTGNLDSKNTVDIMNIIKKISATKLVVLVTHEKELADFYADRVITLKDGVIVGDYQNNSNGDLNLQHDTDIYLKDLEQLSDLTDQVSNLKIYTDETVTSPFEIKLIVKNKTLYLDVNSKDFSKVKLLGNDSEVKVFDKHFEKVTKESFDESTFNLEEISSEEKTIVKHSVISIKESLKYALNRLFGSSKLGKLFYFGFAAGAVLIAIAVGLLANVYNFDQTKFLSGPANTVVVDYVDYTYNEILAFESDPSIDYVSFLNSSISVKFDLPAVYQSRDNDTTYSGFGVKSDYLSSDDIVIGRNVEAYNEIVIDQMIVDNMLKNASFKYIGINTIDDLMNIDVLIPITTENGIYYYKMTIVGISNMKNPVYYLNEEIIYMAKTNIAVYEVFADQMTLSEGVLPLNKGELLMIDDPNNTTPLSSRTISAMEHVLDVSGLYTSTNADFPTFMMKFADMKELYFDNNYTVDGTAIYVLSNDVEGTLGYFSQQTAKAYSLFDEELQNYRLDRLAGSVGTIVFTLVVLGASSISFFFIIRSSLISRIYEVSVYRALGVTKNDIRKMFVTEIILITTLTSLIGYLATSYVLLKIQGVASDYFEFIHVSFFSLTTGLLLIYVINIISGLLPVSNLLRNTPSEILSKYDF